MRLFGVAVLFCLLFSFIGYAQQNLSLTPGITVDSSQNILGCTVDSGLIQISRVQFEGNKITRETILRAELDVREGDQMPAADLKKHLEVNRRRLYNLQLFHYVRYIALCEDNALTLIFTVQERWYIWPVPIFSLADRNINAWLAHRDWRRLDYGLHLEIKNFRGRNETIRGNVQRGYNQKYEFFYRNPMVSRRYKLGATLGASWYQSQAIDYTTRQNQLQTLRQDHGYALQRAYLSSGLYYRPSVQRQTGITFTYNWQQISDSAYYLNPGYFLGRQKRQFAEVYLVHTRNFRNTFAYPLVGSYLQLSLAQRFFSRQGGNASTALRFKYARYAGLGRNFYYSIGLDAKTTFTRRLAYADNLALGYGLVMVRGYQLYVVGGQQYGLVQQGFSKNILPQQEIVLDFIRSPKFNQVPLSLYLNVFADAGYTRDQYYAAENSYTNQMLASVGIGLHLVTYYDKVITLEYTYTKAGHTGFFVGTGIPF